MAPTSTPQQSVCTCGNGCFCTPRADPEAEQERVIGLKKMYGLIPYPPGKVQGTCSPREWNGTDETLTEFNRLIPAAGAKFVVVSPIDDCLPQDVVQDLGLENVDKVLTLDFDDAMTCKEWCKVMMRTIFADAETGVCIGSKFDSAAQAVGFAFCIPDIFYHFMLYVVDGHIFFDSTKKQWDVVAFKKDHVARIEEWMHRQVGRLQAYKSTEEGAPASAA